MDDEKRRPRDEVAELTQAIRDLRDQIAQRDQHHCHGYCLHWHYTPAPVPYYPTIYTPYTVTCGSTTDAPALTGTVTYS